MEMIVKYRDLLETLLKAAAVYGMLSDEAAGIVSRLEEEARAVCRRQDLSDPEKIAKAIHLEACAETVKKRSELQNTIGAAAYQLAQMVEEEKKVSDELGEMMKNR